MWYCAACENVTGLEPGLYRYLAVEHKLCLLRAPVGLAIEPGYASGGVAVNSNPAERWNPGIGRCQCWWPPGPCAADSG